MLRWPKHRRMLTDGSTPGSPSKGGKIMTVRDLPASTNFAIHYEDSIANSQTRAGAIASVCEAEFAVLNGWFGITTGFGTGDRIHVYLDQPDGSGANNFGYQSGGATNIHLDVQSGNKN